MKLYITKGACSLSPHIILEEAGLKYEIEAVDLATKSCGNGQNFLEVNPKGYIPALQLDSGQILTEGPAIVQYIADLVPERRLAPANGSLERYQLQAWLTFIGTEIHKSFSAFFNPSSGDVWREAAKANLHRRLEYVDKQLGEKQFLLGEDFTVADAYLFTVLNWAKFIQLDMSGWPRLVAYQARVAKRPHVQAVLAAEGLA